MVDMNEKRSNILDTAFLAISPRHRHRAVPTGIGPALTCLDRSVPIDPGAAAAEISQETLYYEIPSNNADF